MYFSGHDISEITQTVGLGSNRTIQILDKILNNFLEKLTKIKLPDSNEYVLNFIKDPLNFFEQQSKIILEKDIIIKDLKKRNALLGKYIIEHTNTTLDDIDQGIVDQISMHQARIYTKRVLETNIEDLDISVRTYNCLMIYRVFKLRDLVQCNAKSLRSMKNFGKRSLQEIQDILREKNLSLGMDISEYYPEGVPEFSFFDKI